MLPESTKYHKIIETQKPLMDKKNIKQETIYHGHGRQQLNTTRFPPLRMQVNMQLLKVTCQDSHLQQRLVQVE